MVARTTLIALIALAGCKSKEPAKQPPTQEPAPATPTVAVDKLPELAASSKLSLADASGIVRIAADGSLQVGTPPAPVTLDGLDKALGLAPVAPRRDSDFIAVEGKTAGLENPTDVQFAKLGHPARASGAPAPLRRLTSAFAIAHPNDVSGGVIIVADASAPAGVLVDVLAKVGGFVAVRTGKDLGALPLQIDRQPPAARRPDQPWVELRLDQAPAELATPNTDAVDVLVGAQSKVQDLVRAIAQLRAAKVDAIGLGRAPADGSPDATARATSGPRVLAWNFAALAGPDKIDQAPMRTAFDATLEAIRQCYAIGLTKNATREPQTALVSFVVPPAGKVTTIDVTGVAAPLATCVTTAVKAASFPKGSGRVDVEARVSFAAE